MKRAVFPLSLIFICLAGSPVAFSQSDAKPKARTSASRVCPFSIIGLWKSAAMAGTIPIVFDFSPEGWVTLLGPSPNNLPQDFEVITNVNYKLDKPAAPRRIEFTAARGTTSMQIVLYSDDSFITVNPISGDKAEWVRVQTHRYFLTFAGRSGPPQGVATFAMLTILDGRQTKVEALGIQMTKAPDGKPLPVFGPISAELYDQLTDENQKGKKNTKDKKSTKDETVIMRLELTAAEFDRTHKVFEIWDKYVKTQALPHNDPSLNVMEFLRRTAESLDRCDEKLKLHTLTGRERDEIVSNHNLSQQPLEYIRVTRKKNEELHVKDSEFPWGWRPGL